MSEFRECYLDTIINPPFSPRVKKGATSWVRCNSIALGSSQAAMKRPAQSRRLAYKSIMASIQLERVCQSYVPGKPILSEFSLHVEAGAFCTLVGPSGSGKTTILRLIAGLEKPSAGRILLGSRPVEHLPPAKRGVAMVFQRPAIYPHLTVRENLAFGMRLEQSFGNRVLSYWRSTEAEKAIDSRVDEVADLLGLGP
jgi:ABC-type sugar transport system ATPase subunit